MARELNVNMLRKAEACDDGVAKFRSLFGDSVLVSRNLCREYYDDFNFCWASEALLKKDQYNVFKELYNAARVRYWRNKMTHVSLVRARALAFWRAYNS